MVACPFQLIASRQNTSSTVLTKGTLSVRLTSVFHIFNNLSAGNFLIGMSINIHREMSFWSKWIKTCDLRVNLFLFPSSGMVIKPGDKYTFTVERPFHISKAVIDFSSRPHDSCEVYIYSAITSLIVDCEDHKGIILCNLGSQDTKKSEADLDINFRVGQHITLYSEKLHPDESTNNLCKTLTIHLSGYEFVV